MVIKRGKNKKIKNFLKNFTKLKKNETSNIYLTNNLFNPLVIYLWNSHFHHFKINLIYLCGILLGRPSVVWKLLEEDTYSGVRNKSGISIKKKKKYLVRPIDKSSPMVLRRKRSSPSYDTRVVDHSIIHL